MAISVNTERLLVSEASHVIHEILKELEGFDVRIEAHRNMAGQDYDMVFILKSKSNPSRYVFGVDVKSRITPQTMLALAPRLRGFPPDMSPVLYSPVVSPRVAQMAREQKAGYIDGAGNCYLTSRDGQVLIYRTGIQKERQPTPAAIDPFSPKSSRIVRALLSDPLKGWQVRELAQHTDVNVSVGLVVKVKKALVEEGYAVERERLLYLRDPAGLLDAWAKRYPGPAEQIPIYVRGDVTKAEHTVGDWCQTERLRYAIGGLSAAWRLAPEVRYNVGSVYVEERGFEPAIIEKLATMHGGKRVTSGGNLFLWRPFDRSVFASADAESHNTSPLQTYLDLSKAAGRSEDAAKAVYEKFLKPGFDKAAERAEEWRHAG